MKKEILLKPKSNNSIKSLKRSKTQIPDEMTPEELTTILENLLAEIVALESFVVDKIYIKSKFSLKQKKSKFCKTLTHCDGSKILVKFLNDKIDFLESKIKSETVINDS